VGFSLSAIGIVSVIKGADKMLSFVNSILERM
jgi:hypothetical protein